MNKYTGTVDFFGKKMQFTWGAISELKSRFSDFKPEDIQNLNDLDKIAEIIAIGLKAHNPDITKDDIINMSPPLIKAVNILDSALVVAYLGTDVLEEVEAQEEPKKKVTKKKKTK